MLIGHDQGPALPQLIERRDRAISRAARLTVLIALNVPLEGVDFSVELARVEHCARLQAKRDRWIHKAAVLTAEIDGRNDNAVKSVRSAVAQKASELNTSEEFRSALFELGPKAWPLDAVRSKAPAGQLPAQDAVGKCAVQDIVEKTPEIAETPVEPEKTDPWPRLLRTAPGKETEARIDELVAAGCRPGPEIAQQAIDHKRYDVIELLVKRDLIEPNTQVADQGEKVSLLAYGTRHQLDDSYLTALVQKKGIPYFEHTPIGNAPLIFALAIRRGWSEDLLVTILKNDAVIPISLDGRKVLAILYERKQYEIIKHLIIHGVPTDFLIDGRTFLGKVLFDGVSLATTFILGVDFLDDEPFVWFDYFDFDARGDKGQTALHDLCEGKYDEAIFDEMLKLGADPYLKNQDGKTPIEILFKRAGKIDAKATSRNARRQFDRKSKSSTCRPTKARDAARIRGTSIRPRRCP